MKSNVKEKVADLIVLAVEDEGEEEKGDRVFICVR